MAGKSASDEPETSTTISQRRTSLIIIVVFLVLLILAIFGFAIKQISPKLSSNNLSKMSKNGNETSVVTENGQIMIKEGEVVDGFPTDVAIYDGAEIARSAETADGLTVSLKTNDSVEMVTSFYTDNLKKNDWISIKSDVIEESSLITAKKADRNITISVTVDKSDGKSEINLAVGAYN